MTKISGPASPAPPPTATKAEQQPAVHRAPPATIKQADGFEKAKVQSTAVSAQQAVKATPKYEDASAGKAIEGLKNEPKPISGKAMEGAIHSATKDLDNQAAGKEYRDLKKYVGNNYEQLSPDAKAKFRVYEKYAKAAQSQARTGIPSSDYNKMRAEMSKAGYKDQTAGAAIEKMREQPKPLSGADMQKAITNATKDFDNQAAGKEYADLKKYTSENWNQLSPDAKAKFRVYEKYAQSAQSKGQTGIAHSDYKQMQAEMSRAGYQDQSAGAAIEQLHSGPKPVSGQAMEKAIIGATRDLDNQAAGKEFSDLQKYAKENWRQLSPDAQKKFKVYEKYARASQRRGQTGIPQSEYNKMRAELKTTGYQDQSAGAAIEKLKGQPQPISGDAMQQAIIAGTRDLDGQAAGKEYADLKQYASQNWDKLSPDAKEKFRVYEKYAGEARAKGQTGIGMGDYHKMIGEMKTAGYEDAGAARVIEGLKSHKGPISGEQMQQAIHQGTRDLDNQAAGTEYRDMKEFVGENWNRMTPDAREKWRTYERHAISAQARGMTGIPAHQYGHMLQEMSSAGYADPSSAAAVEKLKSQPGPIDGAAMQEAIVNGTRDFDNQAAGNEYQDLAQHVYSNWDNMTPDAQAKWNHYQNYVFDAWGQGQTGIAAGDYNRMVAELNNIGFFE